MAQLLTATEVATALGVSRAHIYNLLNRGLPSVKVGRCRRFRMADVDAWLDAQNGGEAA